MEADGQWQVMGPAHIIWDLLVSLLEPKSNFKIFSYCFKDIDGKEGAQSTSYLRAGFNYSPPSRVDYLCINSDFSHIN